MSRVQVPLLTPRDSRIRRSDPGVFLSRVTRAWASVTRMDSAHGPAGQPSLSTYDVVIVGGGHNGLTAAAYLARAGLSTLVLERLRVTGGAAVSKQAFAGYDARVSRFSYLVSLMPEQIVTDLRSEEHTSELQSLMRISYAVFCMKKKTTNHHKKQ